MKVEDIYLSSIDFEDDRFRVGNGRPDNALIESIRQYGIINPPILKKIDKNYIFVTGWKRTIAFRSIGDSKLLAKAYDGEELSDTDFLKIVYLDNKDRYDEVDKSLLIRKFIELAKLNENQIRDEILPLLKIPNNKKNLDKYILIGNLSGEILDAYYSEKITFQQVALFSKLKIEGKLEILNNVVLEFKLNNNEAREVLNEIEEIVNRDNQTVLDIIQFIHSRISGSLDKNSFRYELKKLRYPEFVSVENKYKSLLKELDFPSSINLVCGQYFEGNDFELRMKVKGSQELKESLLSISEQIDNGKIDKLLSIITKGY